MGPLQRVQVLHQWGLRPLVHQPRGPGRPAPDGTGGGGFDTDDHGIDIVVPADGSPWRWKDVDDPEAMAAAGRITTAAAEQIHAAAAAVAALLDTADRWWQRWDTWCPGTKPPGYGASSPGRGGRAGCRGVPTRGG